MQGKVCCLLYSVLLSSLGVCNGWCEIVIWYWYVLQWERVGACVVICFTRTIWLDIVVHVLVVGFLVVIACVVALIIGFTRGAIPIVIKAFPTGHGFAPDAL